jgi:hypothetical protein
VVIVDFNPSHSSPTCSCETRSGEIFAIGGFVKPVPTDSTELNRATWNNRTSGGHRVLVFSSV